MLYPRTLIVSILYTIHRPCIFLSYVFSMCNIRDDTFQRFTASPPLPRIARETPEEPGVRGRGECCVLYVKD